MKPFATLLSVSLVANVTLAVIASREPSNATTARSSRRSEIASENFAAASPAEPSTHRADAENFVAVINRLRAAGFPPAVLAAAAEAHFKARRAALAPTHLPRPYWQEQPDEVQPENSPELRALQAECQAAMKAVLPAPTEPSDDESRVNHVRTFGFLPPEKASRVLQAQLAFSRALDTLSDLAPQDQPEKYRALQKEEHATLAAILTPAELEMWEQHHSPVATQMRTEFYAMHLTEAEYRALFALKYELEQAHPRDQWRVPGEEQARAFAVSNLNDEAKALFSPERYADFLQASNPAHQDLNQLVVRLDLSLSAAAQVAAIQRDIEHRARAALPADRPALATEATSKIARILGDRGLEAYREHGGQWLDRLAPLSPVSSE